MSPLQGYLLWLYIPPADFHPNTYQYVKCVYPPLCVCLKCQDIYTQEVEALLFFVYHSECGCLALIRNSTNIHECNEWFSKGVCQGSCLFNLYAKYIMWNARLNKAQAGIKIAGGNINNLRYADDTTLMAKAKRNSKASWWKWKVKVKSFSCVRPSATPWTVAFQAPPSMWFSRQ